MQTHRLHPHTQRPAASLFGKGGACLLLCLLLLGCAGRRQPAFQVTTLNRFTPVQQQGRSQLCWVYAMLAAIETEHIMRGDSVCLSVPFISHHLQHDPQAPSSQRGMAATLIRLLDRYGAVPQHSMPDDRHTAPRWAFMLGAEYSPREFAHSVCAPGEYVALTTNSAFPYGEEVVPDLPDNWTHESFLNLPPDSLLALTVRAVATHRGVCWEGDTGDAGFDWPSGTARLTALSVLNRVTDDHCMAVVGLARDDGGQPYLIMKNSWGTGNARQGLLYMSYDYFLRNTVSVVLPADLIHTCN